MTTQRNGWCWKVGLVSSLALGGAIITFGDRALAQLAPDNTLPTNSRVTSLDSSGVPVDQIDQGTIRGTNLFHSFREFNVGEGRGAYFTNPDGIENILSRVTGNNPSNILGTLGVLGNANLFLMNPNGIFFGPNASLDVSGSFMATTANAFQFGNQGFFSASAPNAPSVLTVNPSALLFNQIKAQTINVNSRRLVGFDNSGQPLYEGLRVPDSKGLLLVGGNLSLNGGALFAPGGRVELGSVAGNGSVSLSPIDSGWSLGYEGIQNFGNIQLSQSALINANGEGGGDIQIQGAQLDLSQGSYIFADTLGLEDGGEVFVRATETISLKNSSWIRAHALGSGSGGNLTIETGQLTLQDGSWLSAWTVDKGKGGNLTVNSSEFVELIGTDAGNFSSSLLAETYGTGAGGSLSVDTRRLAIRDGAAVSASTFGAGNAGNLTIRASESVEVNGTAANDPSILSKLASQVNENATGAGGNLSIKTKRLAVQNGAQVQAGTFGMGFGGNLEVDASEFVKVVGTNGDGSPSGLFTATYGAADAGNLTITTDQLSIREGGSVSASTAALLGKEQGGNLSVNASESVEVIGTSKDDEFKSSLVSETGRLLDITTGIEPAFGGSLTIDTEQLIVQDGAKISSQTFALAGDAGDLRIQAGRLTVQDGAVISSKTFGTGDAGNLNIAAERLIVSGDEALVSTSSEGDGDAGDLNVRASNSVELNGPGGLFAQVNSGTGAGGDLTIQTKRLSINNGAAASTSTVNLSDSTPSEKDAGDLTIRASEFVELRGEGSIGSAALSQVGEPERDGGDLTIETGQLNISDGAFMTSFTSGAGDAGDLLIRASDSVEVSGGGVSTENLGGTGDGGNLTIETGQLIVRDGSQIRASTSGKGQGGNITVTAPEFVELTEVSAEGTPNGLFTQTSSSGDAGALNISTGQLKVRDASTVLTGTLRGSQGRGGNLTVTAESFTLTGGSGLFANTFGQGNAGSISVKAKDVSLDFGQLIATTEGSGRAGSISVNATESFTLTDGAGLFASTLGTGDAGDIFVQAKDISLARGFIFSTVETGAEGKGGDIDITTGSLALTNKSEINASIFGQNDAGSISLQAEDVSLANRSGVFTTVQSGAVGNGGIIDLQAKSLDLSGGSQLQAIVFREQGDQSGGQGKGGDIRVKATDSVSLSGVSPNGFSSGLLTSTERGARGPAGSITVTTDAFRIADGAVVDALTANSGRAGDITINANTFEAAGGGQVLTTTQSSGDAGSITLNVADSITISSSDPTFANRLDQFGEDIVNNQGPASGVFANTSSNSTGSGGSILINPLNPQESAIEPTKLITISDSAGISVDSEGQGNGGNLQIRADNLNLDNRVSLSAKAESGKGGNIVLETRDARLRRESNISTTAGTQGGPGSGGNIDINTDTLVGLENSDITANAFEGRGGFIQIEAQGVLGLERREQLTKNSDITAFSQQAPLLSGTVEINTPDTELQGSLTQLSANFISPEQVVAGSCLARRNLERGSFTVTGTGGLPRSPYEAISGRYDVTGVQPIQGGDPASTGAEALKTTPWKKGDPIQEAQGMVVTADGRTIVGTTPQLVALAKAQHLVCHSD